MSMAEIADSALPSYCHGRAYPTLVSSRNNNGTGLRVSDVWNDKLLNDVMSQADELFCLRYTGNKGGEQATKVSCYHVVY